MFNTYEKFIEYSLINIPFNLQPVDIIFLQDYLYFFSYTYTKFKVDTYNIHQKSIDFQRIIKMNVYLVDSINIPVMLYKNLTIFGINNYLAHFKFAKRYFGCYALYNIRSGKYAGEFLCKTS
jgi:hypothetical protein